MLDRRRLLKIEALADEVLRTHEKLVYLDRQRNGRREALGCFRRGEVRGGTQWMATEGQFLRLPTAAAKDWLQQRQEATDAEVAAARLEVKEQTRELLQEHPDVTGLHPGVCELLLQEQVRKQNPDGDREEGGREQPEREERDDRRERARAEQKQVREEKRKRNTLDYSRFDNIDDSDSDRAAAGEA
mmetsp:Transcript_73716/g.208152  ORF Transcript_73716/g.208152 Transcript_73716/m.208152 type:complete len:187 (+) Transcript_73716:133-693(+)